MTSKQANAPKAALHNDLTVTPLRRLMSGLYDWLIVIALMIVCWIPVVIVSETVLNVQRIPGFVIGFYALLLSFGYFAYFWRRGGQTVGMKTWHIKLITSDAKPASLKIALLRYCGAILALLPGGLGFWWGYSNPERTCWHDDWSDSRLCRVPKK